MEKCITIYVYFLWGILLKKGAYGLIRINMGLLRHAHYVFLLGLVIIGAVQIIYTTSTSHVNKISKKKNNLLVHMTMSHIGIGSDLKDALL
jgi:NAD(P)H-quinone oxidoreductase subunit 4